MRIEADKKTHKRYDSDMKKSSLTQQNEFDALKLALGEEKQTQSHNEVSETS